MSSSDATAYRGTCARPNYLSQDRPDIRFAAKEASRSMAKPREGDWILLKRIGRYLNGVPRLRQRFEWQVPVTGLSTFVDSDWAGCKKSCKSTSGGVVMAGKHSIAVWSSTQAVIALSSGEAELYAMIKGSIHTLGMMSLAADFGETLSGRVLGDSSAALGIINRTGVGKLRHIKVQYLWLQSKVREGALQVRKVLGTENGADLMIKHVPETVMDGHLRRLYFEKLSDRPITAPSLAAVTAKAADVIRGTC